MEKRIPAIERTGVHIRFWEGRQDKSILSS